MAPEIDRSENSFHPPRWADALLRSILTPEDAEVTSGDLIEVYRDSIRPLRGRWQADLWYLRQAAGCMLRAKTPMNLRNWLLSGLTLAFLILVFSALMYPISPSEHPKVLVGIIAGFLYYAYVAVWRTRPSTPEDDLVLRLGGKWGLALGTLWIAAYSLWPPTPVTWLLVFAAFALPFICGAHGAIRTGKMRNGVRVGFWSGLISGLMVFLMRAALVYFSTFVLGLPGDEIPRTPLYTAAELQRVNIFDSLGNALVHLFLFGGALGAIAGMVSGLVFCYDEQASAQRRKRCLPHWF